MIPELGQRVVVHISEQLPFKGRVEKIEKCKKGVQIVVIRSHTANDSRSPLGVDIRVFKDVTLHIVAEGA